MFDKAGDLSHAHGHDDPVMHTAQRIFRYK